MQIHLKPISSITLTVAVVLVVIIGLALSRDWTDNAALTQPTPENIEQQVPSPIPTTNLNAPNSPKMQQNSSSGPTNTTVTPRKKTYSSVQNCIDAVLRTEANDTVQKQGIDDCYKNYSN